MAFWQARCECGRMRNIAGHQSPTVINRANSVWCSSQTQLATMSIARQQVDSSLIACSTHGRSEKLIRSMGALFISVLAWFIVHVSQKMWCLSRILGSIAVRWSGFSLGNPKSDKVARKLLLGSLFIEQCSTRISNKNQKEMIIYKKVFSSL